MTRHAPERATAVLHVDHRMVEVSVQRRRPGYAFIFPVCDAGPSTRGLYGDRIRRAWDRTQWKEITEAEFAERVETT